MFALPKIIAILDRLAGTSFQLPAWREVWREHGWSYAPQAGDEFGFQVDLPELADPLSIDPLGAEILGARLAFHWWEHHDAGWYDAPEDYERELRRYRESFDEARTIASEVIGAPAMERETADGKRAAIWERSHGLVLLIEALFDPQFGAEIAFWLEPCGLSSLPPAPADLVSWIAERHAARHEAGGHPPLA
jgi:hypothetical protein